MLNRRILNYLKTWANRKDRKPLLLRGSRQVGKTVASLMFAKANFEHLVHLNLDKVEHARLFREELSLKDFEQVVQIKFKQKLIPGKTLVFLDEVQNSPALIKLLRFFYEEMPALHVLAAGSLVEVMIEREGFSFPVGRAESAYMYPLDFFEFLEAKKENELLDFLLHASLATRIPQALHEEAMRQFREYALIGGMPEAVKTYIETKNHEALKVVYESLLTGYYEDVYKYSSQAASKYLQLIIEQAPVYAGLAIRYEKFGDSQFRSREMSGAFATLEKAMLLYQVEATKSTALPLVAQPKRAKKLLFLDAGLVNYRMDAGAEFLSAKDLEGIYRGRIAEQLVGQNILAQFTSSIPKLLYWAREKAEGAAEVDFCFSSGGEIVAVEVKSGKANHLRSLLSLAREVKHHHLVRVYSGTLRRDQIQIKNDSFPMISIPFYLIPRLSDVKSFL